MNIKQIVLLMLALSVGAVKAQQFTPAKGNVSELIEIDRLKDTNLYFWKLSHNHQYVFKLKNVNRFVFKAIKSEQTGTSLFTEIPAAFTGIKLPGFSTKKIISVKSSPDPEEKKVNEVFDPCNCVGADSLIRNINYLKTLNDVLVDSLELLETFAKSYNLLPVITDSLSSFKEDVTSSWDSIEARKGRLKNNFFTILSSPASASISGVCKNLLVKTASDIAFIETQSQALSKAINAVIDACKALDTTKWIRALKCLDPCKSKKDSQMYYAIEDTLTKIKNCRLKITGKIKSIEEDVAKANDILKEMKGAEKEGKFLALQKSFDLITEENYTYTMDAFIADKDVHDIVFNIEAEDPLRFNQLQKRNIKVKGITTGGIKVDFSTGVFFNFGNNKFLGPDYYYKVIDATNKQIIEAERTKRTMFSIGALSHFYIRNNQFIKPALSLGVSTTASFETVNFHYGVSLLLGKPGNPNRFVITLGKTLREVSLLDNRFKLNTNYTDLPEAVPITKNFPLKGWFFGVTYNLFSPAAK